MDKYSNYTIELKLQSPIVSPFQSDTLFGHICWAIKYLKWDQKDKLLKFLNLFETAQHPPLLISNGFLKNTLPKPAIPPVTQKDLDEIVGIEERIKVSFIIKSIKKFGIISKEKLNELIQEKITPVKLLKLFYDDYKKNPENADINTLNSNGKSMVVQHNTVNRWENRVKKGLYAQNEIFFDENGGDFEIYLKTNYFTKDDIDRIFTFIKEGGFGKDKSTGKGSFDFVVNEGIDLPEAENPNAFMSLSSFAPKAGDPKKGFYNTLLKYGKLGGDYAKGTPEVNMNPFKKPLIMFAAGSTFYDKEYDKDKIYGTLLKDVHKNSKIRHYAYAFPLGIELEEVK